MHEYTKKIAGEENSTKILQKLVKIYASLSPTKTITSELVTLALWATCPQALFFTMPQWDNAPALRLRTTTVSGDSWRIPIWPSYVVIHVPFQDVYILILIFSWVLSLFFLLQSPMTMKTGQTKRICDSTVFNLWPNI